MSKYYNKIIEGDCIEVIKNLEDKSVDLVITSPPYNKMGKYGGALVDNVIYDGYNDNMSEEEYQKWQIEVLDSLYRVVKDDGNVFYNHKVRHIDGRTIHPVEWLTKTKWRLWQEIIWNRKIAGNIRGWRFWQVDERIYWLVKQKPPELSPRSACLSSVWEIPPEKQHDKHPAPFPIEIPVRIIYSVLGEKDGVVLDPFCGSGTTAVAAALLNKKYICIDISKEYVEYARKRVDNATSEYYKVMSEVRKHNHLLF